MMQSDPEPRPLTCQLVVSKARVIMLRIIAVLTSFCHIVSGQSSWSIRESYFISKDSLNITTAVRKELPSGSLVECCVLAQDEDDSSGVAHRDGKCYILNGAGVCGYEEGDDNSDGYQVMMFDTDPRDEVLLRFCAYITAINFWLSCL